jgi:hypothetical protein
MIRRLAYLSHPRPGLPAPELSRIVVTSRMNNARDRLCGVLVYAGTDFAQLIEGAAPRVERVWTRIRRDDRHRDVMLLFDESALRPWFADWRMGYLADRNLSLVISAWRGLGAMDEQSRFELRQLLAAADSL